MNTQVNTLLPSKAQGNLVSGILLIAGTCIGAGMLALPVATGLAGFLPSMAVNTVCWLFMLCTGLLFLEAALHMKENSNVLTMAQRYLGPIGKWVGGFSFLFLYYCLEVSYISGGTPVLASFVQKMTGSALGSQASYLLFIGLFGAIVYLGTRVLDRINWILMVGLILSYCWLIGIGSSEIQAELLARADWTLGLAAAPVFFSAYGFHNIIPSITTYLDRDAKKLRLAIIIGTSVPFIVYSFWQWMIIGTLTEAELFNAVKEGVPITQTLQHTVGHSLIGSVGAFFGFFALITSFLGVSLSMIDFLADGIQKKAEGFNRLWLCFAVFIPPMVFAQQNPGIFLEAIGYAGGFGEAILNGLFPIGMVWVARYRMGLQGSYQVPGGRVALVFLTLFTLCIIGLEIQHVLS